MDKELASYFFDEVCKALGFVVTDHGFAPAQLEVDDGVNFAFATFMGKNLAIECSLDEREGDVECYIARVINGEKTTHWAVDESGVRVRDGLSDLLERRGVRERLFTRVGGLGLREQIPITLGDFAQMLRKHGQEILNDSPTALADPPETPRRRLP